MTHQLPRREARIEAYRLLSEESDEDEDQLLDPTEDDVVALTDLPFMRQMQNFPVATMNYLKMIFSIKNSCSAFHLIKKRTKEELPTIK